MQYDVIIIGAGAAGISSAVYTCRKKLKTAIISIDVGGQTNLTSNIENYPGVQSQHGHELMKSFKKTAEQVGCQFINGKVVHVDKRDHFIVRLASGETFTSKVVICCIGKVPRQLNIPGEDKFIGRGVHQSIVADGAKYQGKTVAIVGGGNSAFDGALALANIAKKVYLVHRRKAFRADEMTVQKVSALKNVEMILDSTPQEIRGREHVEKLVITKEGNKEVLPVDGVFIEVGFLNDPSIVAHLVDVNEKKEIIINDACETRTPGLFAAGDATIIPFKQTVISAGEGAKAGLTAYTFITGSNGVAIDWTH